MDGGRCELQLVDTGWFTGKSFCDSRIAQFGWLTIDTQVQSPNTFRRGLVTQLVGRTRCKCVGRVHACVRIPPWSKTSYSWIGSTVGQYSAINYSECALTQPTKEPQSFVTNLWTPRTGLRILTSTVPLNGNVFGLLPLNKGLKSKTK